MRLWTCPPIALFAILAATIAAPAAMSQDAIGDGQATNGQTVRKASAPTAPQTAATARGAAPPPAPASADYRGAEAQPETAAAQTDRDRLWNSREMIEARQYILQYSRRSVQFTPSEARQYISRLEQMSAPQLADWLERFKKRRAQIARGTAVSRLARQQSVGQALQRIQQRQQSLANIDRAQTAAAIEARDELRTRGLLAESTLAAKTQARDTRLELTYMQGFNPFAPAFDPASPDAYTRWAAAASLPGDLVDSAGNNIVGTDADVAALSPVGESAYIGGDVPGVADAPPGPAD